jgi:hypothetical protein
MISFKNSLKSAFGAVKKSVPNNWFLKGDDNPSSVRESTKLTNAYANSAWVFSALRFISGPIMSARLTLLDGAEGEPVVMTPSLMTFLEKPVRTAHYHLTLPEVIDLMVAIRGIQGEVFLILDDSWLNSTASLYNPLILANREQMRPLYEDRALSGWSYRGGDGTFKSFLKEQVITLRHANPEEPDSLYGIAPWSAARAAAESAYAGSKYAKRVMDQNGDRGNYIVVKGGQPTPEQREILKAELREKRRAAERGEYRDSVFGGDIEVVTPKVSAINSDMADQMAMSRDEVYVAYGVPPSMSTQTESYSIGSASDWYRLITDTCSREASAIAPAFAQVAGYLLGYRSLAREISGVGQGSRVTGNEKRVFARFDFSNHPVMARAREERVDSLEKLFKMGCPVEVGNEFLALGMPEYEGWGTGYLPYSLAPVGADAPVGSGQLAVGSGKSLTTGLDEVSELVREWGAKRKTQVVAKQSAEDAARWAKIDRARNGDRKRVKNAFTNQLMKARRETLKNLDANKTNLERMIEGLETKAGAIDIIFDLVNWSRGLVGTMRSILSGIFTSAGNDALENEVPGDFDPMTDADPQVIAFLADRENMMKGVADEVHAEVLATLEEGISAGETFDELSARVKAIFNDMAKHRAETIARTETGAAYETARYFAFKTAGITTKAWLSGGDDGVTRDTHMAADGQKRGIDDFFEVGQARLLHPADHVHGADHPEELINCRCVLIAAE